MLTALAATLITVADIHAAANNQPSQSTMALKRLFAYQIMLQMD
jgi:hypothetical protein